MACQTVVTQYILPLNQKCVCLEASHWQMPKLEAFPPLPPPMPCFPNTPPRLALFVQILSQSVRNRALSALWAMTTMGRRLNIHLEPAVCRFLHWAHPCIYFSLSIAVAPFQRGRKVRAERAHDLPKFVTVPWRRPVQNSLCTVSCSVAHITLPPTPHL